MQLNKGKRETRASARTERRYYLSLPSTAFEYRHFLALRVTFAKIVTDPSYRDSAVHCHHTRDPCTLVSWMCARVCACTMHASMHACASIPGSRYCNFKDRSGIADRYSDPKYRFRLRRSVPLIFTRMSPFRSTRVSSRGCSATSADLEMGRVFSRNLNLWGSVENFLFWK